MLKRICCWTCALIVGLGSLTGSSSKAADELVQMVIGLVGDQDKDVRAIGLEQVRTEVKGEAATKLFAAELPRLTAEAQVGLLSALADRGDAAARPAVVELLSSTSDEAVRVAAATALGSLGGTQDIAGLLSLLRDQSTPVATAAREALVKLPGEQVPPALAAELPRAQPSVRVEILQILAARRALECLPEILACATDEDPAIRSAAMAALGQLARQEQIPGMVQGVLKAERGKERDAAERAIALVCSRVEDPDRRADTLLTAIGKLAADDQRTLLNTVGRVGGPAALEVVKTALADADPQTYEAGLRALCQWPDASTADLLTEQLKNDEHANHRSMALAALIRVAPLNDGRSDSERLALAKNVMQNCTSDSERIQLLRRIPAIRTIEAFRFVAPYLNDPAFAQTACESIVELAHHRGLREPNKAEFDKALDVVIRTSKDATVVDRARRYQKGQTWNRPAK